MVKLKKEIADFLNRKVAEFNVPLFIKDDPVSVPHLFAKKQDIEIAGLFAALFAWGNRTTIINKSKELMARMDNAPHAFVIDHRDSDLKKLLGFRHRTFNDTDLLYFVEFLRHHYGHYESLETAFSKWMLPGDTDIENALNGFSSYFASLEDMPNRTKKHVSSPGRNSTCKRLNMFLRWMVRKDGQGVDFGIWQNISPSQLICPIDLHVARVAKKFSLVHRKQVDWLAAVELTRQLRLLDAGDPVKYDFALFGLGALEKF